MPPDGAPVRIQVGGSLSVVLGSRSFDAPTSPRPTTTLDLISYGAAAPLGFDPSRPDRSFKYDIGRRFGFIDGRPGNFWTINGHLYPAVPMFMVADGDVVRVTISNHSGEVHPMHLHGHQAVVLRRNDVAATGSPWWIDTLNVNDGESYEVAFVANNPGIWVDHCHNLNHAVEGLIAHLMYEGVTTPYRVGGAGRNHPE
jgi:FtsP/CotA-like multicopper oxidase with cupredoxin domain